MEPFVQAVALVIGITIVAWFVAWVVLVIWWMIVGPRPPEE